MKLYFCVLAIFLGVFINSALTDNPQQIPTNEIPPPAVIAHTAARQQRLHHNLFHNIRMNWALLDALEQKQIADLGWKPVYISFAYINNDINNPVTLYGPTGEDFLWMHRKMIEDVNELATGTGWEVRGWTVCPEPDDALWPLPGVPDNLDPVADEWYIGYLGSYKSAEKLAEIRDRESKLTPTALAGMTLGEFGTLLEYELHTDFHVRFAAWNPIGYRQQSLHPTERIEEKWDDVTYDYLADFYSAHVNPTFWKIHGWIELKIIDWCNANGNTNCAAPLQWTSQWVNGPMEPEILTALEKVADDARARRANPDSGKKHGNLITLIQL